jgi:hypothetical protein
MEGSICRLPPGGCDGFTAPVVEYDHALGCSITGGYRYRGIRFPSLAGVYLYGDFCSGRIWGGIENIETGAWAATELLDSELSISTFGEDEMGELYVADLGGILYRIHGETFCNVAGGTLEIANFSERTVAVEIELRSKDSRAASGTVLLSGSVDRFALGDTELVSCRFFDPAKGAVRAEDAGRPQPPVTRFERRVRPTADAFSRD